MMIKNSFKKSLKASALGLILSSLSASLFAGAAADLEAKLNNINSLKAGFSQTVIDELGSLVDESKGVFELERPQKFRWLVRDPYEQDIVADGINLWQFDRDIEQINVAAMSETFANSPAALLSKTQSELEKDYQVTSLQGEQAGTTIFKLVPIDQEALFELMVMEFHADELFAIQVKDNLGQTTLVELSEAEFNLDFSDDYFKFIVPEGIDVIDSREQPLRVNLEDFESTN